MSQVTNGASSVKHDQLGAYRELIEHLKAVKYVFICPSPETQQRVCQTRFGPNLKGSGHSLEDLFGWSSQAPQESIAKLLSSQLLQQLLDSDILYQPHPGYYASRVRISNFYMPQLYDSDRLQSYYLHSAFPITMDSAFFGPDTYLFFEFLTSSLQHMPKATKTIVDVCCGPGAGAIHMARNFSGAQAIGLDLNNKALELAELNASLNGVKAGFVHSDLYSSLPGLLNGKEVDVIVADPPYIATTTDYSPNYYNNIGDVPIYADGGNAHGLEISLRIVKEGCQYLASGGFLAIFTGVTITAANPGRDPFLTWLLEQREYKIVSYRIYYPDMWTEEIGKGVYANAARIQAVGALLQKV